MADLKIDNSGDLVMDKENPLPCFKLSFIVSDYPAFHLSFRQTSEETFMSKGNKPLSQFMLTFAPGTPSYPDIVPVINGNDELKQRIIILLRTELGEITNKSDFGTELYTVKHLDITQQSTLDRIHDIVYDAVKDILNDPNVFVSQKYGTGPFFHATAAVYIMDGNQSIYDFDLSEVQKLEAIR